MLRKILLEHKLARGNLVFGNSEGNPVDPNNFVMRRFLPAVKATGIGKLRFHDGRHTFGSLTIVQGENKSTAKTGFLHSWTRRTNLQGHG